MQMPFAVVLGLKNNPITCKCVLSRSQFKTHSPTGLIGVGHEKVAQNVSSGR